VLNQGRVVRTCSQTPGHCAKSERTAGIASNETGDSFGTAPDDWAGLQTVLGKTAARNDKSGWRKRRHDLMAPRHDARKGTHIGRHRSKLGAGSDDAPFL